MTETRGRTVPPQTCQPSIARARWYLPASIVIILVSAGCWKRSLPKSELRTITAEVVNAARVVVGHKSEITIRPQVSSQSSMIWVNTASDDIYLSLDDRSQLPQLKQAIAGIARRHRLSFSENSSVGVVRLDLAYRGIRTHSVHIVTPLSARARPPAEAAGGNPRLAIIVDDLGNDRSAADSLLALPFPLTISVLPHLSFSTEMAEEAFRRGDEVLLHLPMESQSPNAEAESIELRVGMNGEQVESTLAGMLATVPHAVGTNNHQGSRATADPALMASLMPALRERGFFFIDSRTTASTVAYDTAERLGVRAASRKVFLDDAPTEEAILAQLELAASDAARDGDAIAIGHPRPATIAALADGIPRIEARGVRLVFASSLAH